MNKPLLKQLYMSKSVVLAIQEIKGEKEIPLCTLEDNKLKIISKFPNREMALKFIRIINTLLDEHKNST